MREKDKCQLVPEEKKAMTCRQEDKTAMLLCIKRCNTFKDFFFLILDFKFKAEILIVKC